MVVDPPVVLAPARKHLGWYAAGLPGAAAFRMHGNRLEESAQVLRALHALYDGAMAFGEAA